MTQRTQCCSSIIANLMPYSKSLTGRFFVPVIEGVSNGGGGSLTFFLRQLIGERTFTPTLTTVQLRGSTSLICCRSARADSSSTIFVSSPPSRAFPSSSLSTLTGKSFRACYNNVTQLVALSLPLVVIAPNIPTGYRSLGLEKKVFQQMYRWTEMIQDAKGIEICNPLCWINGFRRRANPCFSFRLDVYG